MGEKIFPAIKTGFSNTSLKNINGSTPEDAGDEMLPKNCDALVMEGRNGKQSKSSNIRNEEFKQRIGLTQNRPLTSGNQPTKTTTSRLKTTGNIIRYNKANDFRLTKSGDLQKTTYGPPNRHASTHGVAIDYTLKDVPIRRHPQAFKNNNYKSYNLMNAQKSTGKRVTSPRDSSKHSRELKNDLQWQCVSDSRDKISMNKIHNAKINTTPDARPHSGHVSKVSETAPLNLGHQATLPNYLTSLNIYEGSCVNHEGEAGVSDQETEDHEQRQRVVPEENWAETLKSCRYLRKPRGYETPEITIESIFQND